jgi:hypothetical protein
MSEEKKKKFEDNIPSQSALKHATPIERSPQVSEANANFSG